MAPLFTSKIPGSLLSRTAPATGSNTAGNAIKETFRIHTLERPTCHTVQGGSQRSRSTYENVPPKEHKLSSLMLQNHSVLINLMDVLCVLPRVIYIS